MTIWWSDYEKDDDEVYPGLGLMWEIVEDATVADGVLASERSGRKVGSTSSYEIREL